MGRFSIFEQALTVFFSGREKNMSLKRLNWKSQLEEFNMLAIRYSANFYVTFIVLAAFHGNALALQPQNEVQNVTPEVVFENTCCNNIRTFTGTISDKVVLAGTFRNVTDFSFWVITNGLEPANDDFQLRLYTESLDLIWTSDWKYNVPLAGPAQEIKFAVPSVNVPDTLIWEATHTNRAVEVGFLWAGPPTIGSCPIYGGDYHGTPRDLMAKIWAVPEPSPLVADADGPYIITAGDTLTLDASGSVDENNDIVSYMWDLDDDGDFETDANNQPIFDVNYTYLLSLDLKEPNVYDIHLLVTDAEGQSDTADSTLTILPKPVIVDIRPASCFNPLNVYSKGVLPVTVLGTEEFDVNDIDIASVRLAGVAPFRSNYQDVTSPESDDPNACGCADTCPDGYTDLMLKFRTTELAEVLTDIYGEIIRGDELEMTLTGALYDGSPIEGMDYITVVGKEPKRLNRSDLNKMTR